MIGLPDGADIASPQAVAAIKARGAEAEGYALPTYAAVEVAIAANAQASGGPLTASLAKGDFTTAIGKIGFDDKGDLRDGPYRLFRFDGKKFVEADTQ
jgi:branched-chain amino acid transport system substrate-binding protein